MWWNSLLRKVIWEVVLKMDGWGWKQTAVAKAKGEMASLIGLYFSHADIEHNKWLMDV